MLAACFLPVSAQTTPSVIPLPSQMQTGLGEFQFQNKTKIAADAYPGDSIWWVLDRFARQFGETTGLKLVKSKPSKAALYLKLNSTLAAEGYRLDVNPCKVVIEAARPAGFFYALQTL